MDKRDIDMLKDSILTEHVSERYIIQDKSGGVNYFSGVQSLQGNSFSFIN